MEPKESYEKYDTGRFGRGCLLARRLVENGARFVEVTTEYVPFLHWDTHANGHTTLKRMKAEIDRPIAQLILDLESRGLLKRTLVILASEFSRDMIMEGKPGSKANDQATEKVDALQEMKHYGQHRHFTGASCVVMWGGGVRRGQLYGASAGERPFVAIKDRSQSGFHRPRNSVTISPPMRGFPNSKNWAFANWRARLIRAKCRRKRLQMCWK